MKRDSKNYILYLILICFILSTSLYRYLNKATNKWSRYVVRGFILAMFLLVSGCNNKTLNDKIVLDFSCWGVPEELEIYKKLLTEFELKNPNIKVRLEHITRSYESKILTELAGNTAPDVMVFQDEPLPQFAKRGAFLDLTPYIERDKYDLNDFFEIAVKGHSFNGKIYGIPKDGGSVVMFYNKDLFDQFGVKYPDESWTWDSFLNAAKQLTRDTNNDGRVDTVGLGMTSWWVYWFPWIWSNGGDILNSDKTKCLLNEPNAIEGIQFFADLRTKHKVTPSLETGLQDIGDLFQLGRQAMQFTGPWAIPMYRDLKFRWGISYYPKGKAGRVTRYSGDGYCIYSKSKHPEEAWKLVKFLSGPDGAMTNALIGRAVPARKSIALSKSFAKREDNHWNEQIFIDAYNHARIQPITTKWSEMDVLVTREIEALLMKQTTVKKLTEKVTAEIDKLLKDL